MKYEFTIPVESPHLKELLQIHRDMGNLCVQFVRTMNEDLNRMILKKELSGDPLFIQFNLDANANIARISVEE
jgi:hypothetical protein